MIRSLWIAKTGLDAQQTQMDVISHNLANVSTNGYKRSQAVFEDLIYQNMRQVGAQSSADTQLPTGLQLGTGVRPVATSRLFTQGNLQQTSNSFDLAISGHGFFQLRQGCADAQRVIEKGRIIDLGSCSKKRLLQDADQPRPGIRESDEEDVLAACFLLRQNVIFP